EWRDLPAGLLDKGTWEVGERVRNGFGMVQVYGISSRDDRATVPFLARNSGGRFVR
nr:hypothetical protein [Tanacetum cinerariifolium]